jgi:hypothetical protein
MGRIKAIPSTGILNIPQVAATTTKLALGTPAIPLLVSINTNSIVGTTVTITSTGNLSLAPTSNITVNNKYINLLADPVLSQDAATKNYVDNLVAGLRTRAVARVASTTNVAISSGLENGDTLDGITLATGNRVLLKDQSTPSQNGLYTVVASGAASRDTEYDTISELAGQLILVSEGSTHADDLFLCTTDTSATLGSSTISYTQVFPSSGGTAHAQFLPTVKGIVVVETVPVWCHGAPSKPVRTVCFESHVVSSTVS